MYMYTYIANSGWYIESCEALSSKSECVYLHTAPNIIKFKHELWLGEVDNAMGNQAVS